MRLHPKLLDSSFLPSLQAVSAKRSALESSAQVDSRNDYSARAECMDCHALPSDKARNDRKNAPTLNEPAKDSRIFDKNAQKVSNSQARANLDSSKSQSDSKILDEKCGLQGKSQGSYLDGDLWDFSPLPHFSLKAESPQVKVSIIVPVFNTQPHITRCLDSLISQSLRDIEIIIVDDCGSDGAMSIAQEFAARDPRIHILRNLKNLGLLHTRCAGAAMARGEYILYVDSDDYIKPNLCELCYERARESKADMVVFGSECRGFYRYVYQPKGSRIYTGSALSKLIFPTRSKFSPYLWNKLYKRELIAKADSIVSRVAGPITLAEDVLKSLCPFAFKLYRRHTATKALYLLRQCQLLH